jgi:transcriptional regulator, XRE family|nr:MAG TPA: helix-turn-helix domain protein [Caudoviricetes sp.]
MTTIGDRIKARRLELDMSQDELARLVGYKSRSSINKIESDGRLLPQRKIMEIANALNTTPAYIMGWEESNETEAPSVPLTPRDDNEDIRRMVCKIEADPNLRAYIKELEKNPKLVTLGRLSAKTTDAGLESILAVTKQIVKTSGCDDIDPEL